MPRRPIFRPNPLARAYRTLSATSASDVKDLHTAFHADKATKDSKVAALEADKGTKDTKLSDMESDMELLASQVSLGNVRVSLGNLATRVTSLETLGIKGISNAVSWTNLTEINLSGEKLTNGDFSSTSWAFDTSFTFPTTPESGNYTFSETVRIQWLDDGTANFTENKVYEVLRYALHNGDLELENDLGSVVWVGARKQRYNANDKIRGEEWEVVDKVPSNWTVHGGTLNQTKLAQGIIKGSGGHVTIKQTFSQNIVSGTKLIVKVTSDDDIKFTPIKSNGQTDLNNDFTVLGSDGYAEHTTQTNVSGFKVSTVNGLREFSSISIFQGEVSGGTVQAYAGGGLEKISGTSGWNAGASSVQKIDGNSDGYVQFQWAKNALEVGLTYTDDDYTQNTDPYFLRLYLSGRVVASSGYDEEGFATVGDWFRIRHYASTNEVKFQKRQTVYVDDADFCLSQTCGLMPNNGHANDHTFATVDRPLIIAKETVNGLTAGEYYRIHAVNTNSGNTRIYTTAGVQVGWMTGRGTNWEVQKEAGQDYVTFQTANTLSNGSDLYVDTSLYHVESRINDVTIVT